MVKILIVYDSVTGNTEKMASYVAEGARQGSEIEVAVRKVGETRLDDLTGVDGIIIGSPTYYGLMSAKLKALLDNSEKIHGKLEGKVGGAFTSSGGVATGAETTLLSILEVMMVHGMVVQGRSENKHYGATSVGAPSEEAANDCRELGKRVAALVMKLTSRPSEESTVKKRKKQGQ